MKFIFSALLVVMAFGCTKKAPTMSEDQVSKLVFRNWLSQESYKIKSIKETSSVVHPSENQGGVTVNSWSKTLDLEVEVKKDCYGKITTSSDLLVQCLRDPSADPTLKKAGEIIQMKDVRIDGSSEILGDKQVDHYVVNYGTRKYR